MQGNRPKPEQAAGWFRVRYVGVMEQPRCEATKMRPTATGNVEVRCTKPCGHVEAGDRWHQGKTGPFPIKWED